MRAFLLFAVFVTTVFGFESYAKYKTGYGIFTLGEATAFIKIDENGRYDSQVIGTATGLAAVLSGNRKEIYTSKGKVVEGRLVPEIFTSSRETNSKKRTKELYINHDDGLVTQRVESCENKKCDTKYELLDPERYAKDDILTLYHNVLLDLNESKGKPIQKLAAGNKKPVEIQKADKKQMKLAKKLFGSNTGEVLVVTLNQDIFSSKKGELYIDMHQDKTTTKAVLRKTSLFGDVWGEIVEKKISGD